MGFRSFCFLLVAGFIAGCGGSPDNQPGNYSGAKPNQNELAPNPGNGSQPPMQGNYTEGTPIGPTTDINNNPILTPSGVTGAPPVVANGGPALLPQTNLVATPPAPAPVNNGNLVAPPPRNETTVVIQAELQGLACPRTNVVYFDAAAAAQQAAWMMQQKITYQNFQMTLRYFQNTVILECGRYVWAFDGYRTAKLTNMIFRRNPLFDIVQFDRVYRGVVLEGFIGYIAIDEALRRVGINIATCRL